MGRGGREEGSEHRSKFTNDTFMDVCVCVPAVDEVNEPATIYQQKHIEKEGEWERRREGDRQRWGEGAHTLWYGSMLISQETHDKVECFFEKLFDFEQRVGRKSMPKQTKLKDSLHISQFVCVCVQQSKFGIGKWGRETGRGGIETGAGIGLTAPRLCTCAWIKSNKKVLIRK